MVYAGLSEERSYVT
jgi:sedoheptulose-bisphosphatase